LIPSPGEIPRLKGVEIYGRTIPLQTEIGGDHIIYVDYNQRYDLPRRIAEAEHEGRPQVADKLRRCQHRAGILLADVAGHKVTDALIAAMLHQAFLLGVYYELDRFGEITTKIFENINTRFYKTNSINKYLTMIYGEISERGRFRFISAGHERPLVYSREFGELVHIAEERLVNYPPVGMFPSSNDLGERVDPAMIGFKQDYTVNEIDLLSQGDILLLYSDGLSEHAAGTYFPAHVERSLAEVQDETAEAICGHLEKDLKSFATPQDDISLIVIKKTSDQAPTD